jgi:phosphate/phosphite/phosphonate ABC transporter binding protein
MPSLPRRLAILSLGFLLSGQGIEANATPSSETLVIGSISRSIKEEIETFRPLADYLGPHLSAVGIHKVKIMVATTGSEMSRRLANGEVDIYIDSPFVVARMSREVGAKPFLRRWKKGVAEYHTVFITRRDSGIRTLDDLQGRVIAFDDPQSSSGHLLPRAMLLERGYRLMEVADPTAPVPSNVIGFTFSMDDVNTMFWVDRGKVAAGVTSPDFLKLYQKKGKDDLAVIARSIDVPRQVVAHRRDLDPAIVARLERVLIAMETTEDGRQALERFQKTTRFDRFPNGVEATFAPIHAMLDRLDASLTN